MRFLIYSLLLISVIACNVAKKTTASDSTTISTTTTNSNTKQKSANPKINDILNGIYANELNFKQLYAKAKTKANINGINQNFTTQIRWQKKSKIWMSMAVIGIEGARVLITQDSIKIIDRLNQRNILKPISYIEEKAYINLTFKDIEAVLLAQPILFNSSIATLTETTQDNTLISDDNRFKTTLITTKQHYLKSITIEDKLKQQTLLATYANYTLINGVQFPKDRYIRINNGSKVFELTLDILDIDLSKELSFPFELNAKYTTE